MSNPKTYSLLNNKNLFLLSKHSRKALTLMEIVSRTYIDLDLNNIIALISQFLTYLLILLQWLMKY